jgi:glycosyltransferase involved in cell wall biosynthesis
VKIGVVAPPWAPVPPTSYGGIELVVHDLAVGFQEAGHDVVLACTGDSTCPVPRLATRPQAEGDRIGAALPELLHVSRAYPELEEVDIIHDHTVAGPFFGRRPRHVPVVTTAHGPLDGELGRLCARLDRHVGLIAISRAQASSAPDVRVARVIHHGVDVAAYPFGEGDGGYCLFLGRMSPEKGAHLAIAAARRAEVPLVMAAKCREPEERDYFRRYVEHSLDHRVTFLGEVATALKHELLASARALLFPIRWNEPFGMVMIEALACGTPVVALRAGSVPEIVEHGRTGYVCDDEDALADAIGQVDRIDRNECRRTAEVRFSRQRMVEEHLDLFTALTRPAALAR